MPLYTRKRALLAKIESSYGTDPTPSGSANAILVRNLSITPQSANLADRELVRPYLGHSEQIPVDVHAVVEFECELAGSGAAGTAPAWGPLVRACGFAETINAGTSVVYDPVSASFESVTCYFHVDGVLHKLTGARGTVSLALEHGALPVLRFAMTGLYQTVADAALPSLTLTAWKKPDPVNNAYTSALSLHGFANGVMSALSIDVANQVEFRSLVGGSESVLITDRAPAGSIALEAVTVATKDWWSLAKNATTGALSVTHGASAGNKVKIDAPAVQLVNPRYEDLDGIQMLAMDLRLVPSTGNDELKITAL